MEKMTVYIKEGKNYIETFSTTDPATIYQRLSSAFIWKKIHKVDWIKSIKRVNLYNGYQKITVSVNFDCKEEYIIKE